MWRWWEAYCNHPPSTVEHPLLTMEEVFNVVRSREMYKHRGRSYRDTVFSFLVFFFCTTLMPTCRQSICCLCKVTVRYTLVSHGERSSSGLDVTKATDLTLLFCIVSIFTWQLARRVYSILPNAITKVGSDEEGRVGEGFLVNDAPVV